MTKGEYSKKVELTDDRLIEINGTVEHVIYSNEDNGYTVCDFGTDQNGEDELITICGTLPYIAQGDNLTVFGTWTHNAKYGRQFKVAKYDKKIPAGAAAILKYLSSKAIKGIGPKTALKIVEKFGDETADVIENHPDWLADIPGISQKKAREISDDFKAKSGLRNCMIFFRDHLGPASIVKVYKKWGSTAIDKVKHDPYILCNQIDGIGFERADKLAEEMGIDGGVSRNMSGVRYFLTNNAVQNGHVCLPREKLIDGAAMMLGAEKQDIDSAISALLLEGSLKYAVYDGVCCIYDSYMYDCERYIADKLTLLDKVCPIIDSRDVGAFIEKEEMRTGIEYAPSQKKAIFSALEGGVMILTGGPGTGKTTVVKALIDIFGSMDQKVALCAPTGRAAKRMSEATSAEAKTIHRLLETEFSPDSETGRRGEQFRRNENDTLDEQVIIIDEASMIDTVLMCALLKAVKPGARVIVIGDADQLPSVGAGYVLHDLIESKRFATVELKEIFRQARTSLIVTNAHEINKGNMPILDSKDRDFFFLRRDSDRDIALTVVDLYKNRLPRSYGRLTDNAMQIITPSRRGEGGTENLNHLLQAAVNPPRSGVREKNFRDIVFRENDRVMQTKNNYDLEWTRDNGDGGRGIFNGDIGVIESINYASESMTIHFDDRLVEYDFTLLEELEHAYAVTVHKSQGSEYPFVIIPMYSAPTMLLNRNLLYTAVTRAQKMVILVGREDVISKMVSSVRMTMRYSGLAKRLAVKE